MISSRFSAEVPITTDNRFRLQYSKSHSQISETAVRCDGVQQPPPPTVTSGPECGYGGNVQRGQTVLGHGGQGRVPGCEQNLHILLFGYSLHILCFFLAFGAFWLGVLLSSLLSGDFSCSKFNHFDSSGRQAVMYVYVLASS